MKINANGTEISVMNPEYSRDDYLCLTDLARKKNPYEPKDVVKNWLRLRSTIEFLGLWEQLYNPSFKGVEFDTFKNEAGSNAFTLTPQRWIEKTNAIGIISRPGRGGGTYAHKDIAFEFASWISPEFKLYVIKDYQRLKQDEARRLEIGWDTKLPTDERVKKLRSVAYYQLQSLLNSNAANRLKENIKKNRIEEK